MTPADMARIERWMTRTVQAIRLADLTRYLIALGQRGDSSREDLRWFRLADNLRVALEVDDEERGRAR